jgi:hypothetical protein
MGLGEVALIVSIANGCAGLVASASRIDAWWRARRGKGRAKRR